MLSSVNPNLAVDPNYTFVPVTINADRVYTTASTISAPVSTNTNGLYNTSVNITPTPLYKAPNITDCAKMCSNDPTCQAFLWPINSGSNHNRHQYISNQYCYFNTGVITDITPYPSKDVSEGSYQWLTYVKNQNTCSGANQVFDSKSKSCVSCRDPTAKPSITNSPSSTSYTCNNSSIKTFDKNNSLISSTCDSGEVFNTLTNTCSITYNY
jgi:hypothetical protein